MTNKKPACAHPPLFREQFVHIDLKDFGEEENLAVNDRGASDLNVGQDLRRDVAAQPLKFLGQLSLGPAPLVAAVVKGASPKP